MSEEDKARVLLDLFKDVDVRSLETMLVTDAGRLAYAVLLNHNESNPTANSIPTRMLIDELLACYISEDTNRKFVPRQALIAELDDVLRAKLITPYRRSRINKALKRACINCHGGGKVPKVVKTSIGIGKQERHEISQRSPDCMHCKGTGINPKEVEVNGTTVFDLEGLQNLDTEVPYDSDDDK